MAPFSIYRFSFGLGAHACNYQRPRKFSVHLVITWVILLMHTLDLLTVAELSLKGHLQPLGQQRSPEGSIETLLFTPSGRDFYKKFIQPSKPVIIRNAVSHWPAFKYWSNKSYVKENLTNEVFTVEFRKKFKDEYPIRKDILLTNFVERYQIEDMYMDSGIPPKSKLQKDIYLPTCLQCKEISSTISRLNLLWSSGNTSSAFHQDGYDNVLSLISGRKKIILYDSKHTKDLYGNDFSLAAGVSRIDPERVDLQKYPNFSSVPYFEGILEPGDILYIPQYWWHHVVSFDDPNIAVNIWFGMFDFPNEYVANGLDERRHVVEITELFRELASKQPKEIECKDTALPLNEYLKVNMSDSSSIHLRIPRANEKLEDIRLSSGYKMPVLGLGTAMLYDDTTRVVKYALKVGYRLFDTAQGYPLSEESIAKAIRESDVPRSELFIVTKLHPRYLGYNGTLKAINESLKRLELDYIDLFLIHSLACDDFLLKCEDGEPHGTWQDSWKAMEHAQKLRQIRSLGVSNFYTRELKDLVELAQLPVSVVQNWFDPLHQDRKVRTFCEKHGIRYMGYSTLGSYWTFMGMGENPILNSDLLIELSGHYDYVVSHVVLRWAIHKNVTVIPRSSDENHIVQNFRSLDIKLHPLEIKAIDELQDLFDKVMEQEVEASNNASEAGGNGSGNAEHGTENGGQGNEAERVENEQQRPNAGNEATKISDRKSEEYENQTGEKQTELGFETENKKSDEMENRSEIDKDGNGEKVTANHNGEL